MRTFWSGDLSIGQVIIPLKLASSSKDSEPATVQLHKPCSTRIQQVRRCSTCDIDVPWDEVGKGALVSKDKYVLLPESTAEEEQGSRIKVLSIVPTKLPLLRVEKTYWVLPGSKNKKSYILLRDALDTMDEAACVEVILRTSPRTAILAPHADVLTLTMLRAPGDVVPHEVEASYSTEAPAPYSAKELKLAQKLLMSFPGYMVEAEKPMQLAREKIIEEATTQPLEDLLTQSIQNLVHPKKGGTK
jgi:DNA end-binding protein Ku